MKIMIVDDSSFILLICRQALEKAGYEVVAEAHDGEEAIAKADSHRPDFIIMDIALPKKNGFEATEAILKSNPATKILAISAIDDDWVQDKAIESGCIQFLSKPFQTVELIDIIERENSSKRELKYG